MFLKNMFKTNALAVGLVLFGLNSMAAGEDTAASKAKMKMPEMDMPKASGMDMSNMDMSKKPTHPHKNKPVPEGSLIPSIDLDLTTDNMDGYNLTLSVDNYRMLPPGISETEASKTPQAVLRGHAHLFINGVKIGRIYGKYTHIPKKHFKGTINQLTVFLNGDDHSVWTSNKQQILSTLFVKPNNEKFIAHRFAPFTGLK